MARSAHQLEISQPWRQAKAGPFVESLTRTRLRIDGLLTPHRVKLYPILVLVITLATYLVSVGNSAIAGGLPFDSFGYPIAVDLSAHVTGGAIALSGDLSRLYDLGYQFQVQQHLLGGGHEGFFDVFLSPPFVAYIYAPFAALPYWAAAVLWTLLTLILLVLSFHLLWPVIPNLHRYGYRNVLLVVLSSWPVFELVADGQDSALSLLLLAAGLRLLLAQRDLAAGLVLGLGVFKPQLFLMIPILLLLQRRWRALGAWVCVAAILAGISVAIIGTDGIHSYIQLLTSNTYNDSIVTRLDWKMQSVTALARGILVGPAAPLVTLATLAGGAIALVLMVRAMLRTGVTTRSIILPYAFTILLIPLFNPHLFLYDLVVLLPGILLLLNEAPSSSGIRVSIAAICVLSITAPLRYLMFGNAPQPLPILSASWTVVPLLALIMIAWTSLSGKHAGVQAGANLS